MLQPVNILGTHLSFCVKQSLFFKIGHVYKTPWAGGGIDFLAQRLLRIY